MTISTESARERLLQAATDVFGRHGYDAATTRMIASEAKVNIAAIPYYFSSKEGLYLAVIDHLVGLVACQLADIRTRVHGSDFTGTTGSAEAAELLELLLERMIGFMVGSPQAQRVSRIILREQLYPTSAYDRIFSGFMAPALDVIARLIMVISKTTDARQARVRAMSLIGQILVFRVARETAVRALAMKGYTESETKEIRFVLLEHTRAIIASLAHE